MTESRLSAAVHDRLDGLLDPVDERLAAQYPGNRDEIQPVHTIYVSAADATVDTPRLWGVSRRSRFSIPMLMCSPISTRRMRSLMCEFNSAASRSKTFGSISRTGTDAAATKKKTMQRRRPDRRLPRSALILPGRTGVESGSRGLPAGERRRSIRTLELVLDAAGGVPDGFVFTVPKLRAVEQVTATVLLCEELEKAHGLELGSLRFELQIESPQAVIAADGTVAVAQAIHRGAGRLTGLHYGTYDYSAACGIASRHQSLEHPVADHAKAVMLAAAAQTGVWVCDGSTQVAPVGSATAIRDAITRHHRLVTRSLERGYYQGGWDMHPGHLVTRWLATFGFYRNALGAAAPPRIQSYLGGRQGGDVMDEPATAQALAAVVLRGLDAGGLIRNPKFSGSPPSADTNALRHLVGRTTPITGEH